MTLTADVVMVRMIASGALLGKRQTDYPGLRIVAFADCTRIARGSPSFGLRNVQKPSPHDVLSITVRLERVIAQRCFVRPA